jgi:hypothetical protein
MVNSVGAAMARRDSIGMAKAAAPEARIMRRVSPL